MSDPDFVLNEVHQECMRNTGQRLDHVEADVVEIKKQQAAYQESVVRTQGMLEKTVELQAKAEERNGANEEWLRKELTAQRKNDHGEQRDYRKWVGWIVAAGIAVFTGFKLGGII
ncbi:MAG: hypothetical protein WCK39_00115 [Methanomassiliicoccales archaeon]